jgi:hypothetical protein
MSYLARGPSLMGIDGKANGLVRIRSGVHSVEMGPAMSPPGTPENFREF